MKELHTLHDTAQEMLGGLTAGEAIRRRVLEQAAGSAESSNAPERRRRPVWVYGAACAALALVLGISVLTANNLGLGGKKDGNTLDVFSAGQSTALPGSLMAYADVPEDSLVITGDGTQVEVRGELPPDVFTQQQNTEQYTELENGGNEASVDGWVPVEGGQGQQGYDDPYQEQQPLPGYSNIFVQGQGANFPLVGLYGRAYQQTVIGVGEHQLGEPVGAGAVSLYTQEPSLVEQSIWNGEILSNVAPEGTMVYQVQGISAETAVAVPVDGAYYLFQRVTYAGYGTGGQTLEQTLDVRGNVASLTLSDVGTLTDGAKANAMISLLLDNATFYADQSFQGRQSLDIVLNNGLTLQMQVSDGIFSACGSWTCSEFFTEFRNMLGQ